MYNHSEKRSPDKIHELTWETTLLLDKLLMHSNRITNITC